MRKLTIPGLLLALSPLPSPAAAQVPDSAGAQFMRGMIHHHAQALLIAGWIPTHGASSQLRVLGERIVVSQNDEIAQMQRWLRERSLPVPEAVYNRHAMHGGEHGEHADHHGTESEMPGMLSPAQLTQLDSARGTEFERLFLLLMIQHHRGAITMVERLRATGVGQDPVVFRMASDISADQAAEIDRMVRMMALLPSPRSNR